MARGAKFANFSQKYVFKFKFVFAKNASGTDTIGPVADVCVGGGDGGLVCERECVCVCERESVCVR